jgi:hypothetical protein
MSETIKTTVRWLSDPDRVVDLADIPGAWTWSTRTWSTPDMTSEQEPLLQFFTFDHLRADCQPISRAFHDLAYQLVNVLPRNPERTTAIRKLLEAKDCAVRAKLWV